MIYCVKSDISELFYSETIRYFSSVCWLFGKHLNQKYGVPMGLITSAWGGTMIESWSSPTALAACGSTYKRYLHHSVLLMHRPWTHHHHHHHHHCHHHYHHHHHCHHHHHLYHNYLHYHHFHHHHRIHHRHCHPYYYCNSYCCSCCCYYYYYCYCCCCF